MTNLWAFLLQTLYVTLAGLVVLAVKELLKGKLTPRWQYFVWWVVALRLLIPVSTRGRFALLPLPLWVESWKILAERGLTSAYTSFYEAVKITSPFPWLTGRPVSVTDWLFLLYVAGVVFFLLRYLVSYLRLRLLLRQGTPAPAACQGQIRRVGDRYGLTPCPAVVLPGLPSPMVCGVFRPVLALPQGAEVDDHVILHELLHVKHRDALQNVFWCLCRALHWCNPLVQWMLDRVGNDLESLCDQRVLEKLEGEARRDYGIALLAMANDRYPRAPGTTSISNGGRNIRRRIEAIVHFKGYPKGMALASVCVTVMLLCACLMGTVEPDLDMDSGKEGTLATAEAISTARLTHCTTVAGALDTYAKGLIEGNRLYLMMAAPLAQQQAMEEQVLRSGQIHFAQEAEDVTVYRLWDWYQTEGDGVQSTLVCNLLQEEYGVCGLKQAEDGSYTALLVCSAYPSGGEEMWNGQGVLVCPVRVYQEDGYVVEPAGDNALYLGNPEQNDTFTPEFGCPFLPADRRYYGAGESGTVTVELHSICRVENRVTEETSAFGGGIGFDPVPRPDAVFSTGYTVYAADYTFGGSQAERDGLSTAGIQIVCLDQAGAAPNFSQVDEYVGIDDRNTSGSSSAGYWWSNVEVTQDWDGTITTGSGDSSELFPSPWGFAARVLWNGEAKETLTLKEVPVNGP